MKILAVDTALGACSVAVLDGKKVLAHRFVPMERGHAEALAPMVEAAMTESGLSFAALDRLAVTTGPGTFTGQRVGLAFMRGLRLALECPLIGVTTLAAMASAALEETGASAAAALHDAKRGEVYLEAATAIASLLPAQLQTFTEAVQLLTLLPAGLALAGTAAPAAAARLKAAGIAAMDTSIRAPDALWVARLALTAPEPDGPPRPLYLRAPDAKLPSRAEAAHS